MGLPILITIILIGRGVSLPNASDGTKLYFATWRSEALAQGAIWQAACGQVFFSTGVGFGYFTSYASYNTRHSNAVMDSVIICCTNALFETLAAFAVFGAIGFIGLTPEPGVRLGSFTVGFLTLPEAVAQMPAAQFWAALLFLCLMVLGFSSSFAMLDAIVTLVMDTGVKLSRPMVVTSLVLISFLLGLPYCTQFGYYLLNGIDRWLNDVALIFVVWAECISATTIYRWRDVASQVGLRSFIAYNVAYFGGIILGPAIGHAVSPAVGAGVGFAVIIFGTMIAILLARRSTLPASGFWNRYNYSSTAWYLMFYSGNQLRRDLNAIVGTGRNWSIPKFWPFLLRYVSAPILAIVYSFSYPAFYLLRYDPLHIAGFILAHLILVVIVLGLIVPRWFAVLLPPQRLHEGGQETFPHVAKEVLEGERASTIEEGRSSTNESEIGTGEDIKENEKDGATEKE